MADFCFNVGLGQAYKMTLLDATKFGILLLATTGLESDAVLKDLDTLTALVAGATNEATNTGYARKTGLTVTPTLDDTNNRVDLDIPDQTWSAVANDGTGAISKLVVFYEVAAADGTRVPLTCHDFAVTPDGSDIVAQVAAAGFFRAS